MIGLLALASILAVAATGVSLFAVWRSQALAELSDRRARAVLENCRASTAELEKTVSRLAGEVRDLDQRSPGGSLPGLPRAGLNLSKRSQVLRMHRQGDPSERIAAALEVPRQEVDLLIKVNRIVIGRVTKGNE